VGTGIKEDESSTGRIQVAGFQHAAVLTWRTFRNLRTIYYFNFPISFSGHGKLKPWILNQQVEGA
jgi:hypothetical protein